MLLSLIFALHGDDMTDNYDKIFGEHASSTRRKNKEEVDLIANYTMDYGDSDNWSDGVREDFDNDWEAIQNKYPLEIRNRT